MIKAKIRTSDLYLFEEEVCEDCLNDDSDQKLCYMLGQLAVEGECDGVYTLENLDEETGSFHKCLMRRTEEEVSIPSIVRWIDTSSTEEVFDVLTSIEESYHYGVIKKGKG